jgi:hypothetical protein
MSFRRTVLSLALTGLVGGCLSAWAQEAPRAGSRGAGVDASEPVMEPRAILQIKSEAGTCYWRVQGDDDLLRIPAQDDRFTNILLSARFDEDQLHLSIAGERGPLDTSSLGLFDLGLKDGAPVTVNSFRAVKSRMDGSPAGTGGWELRVLPPQTKVDTTGCCTCGLVKLSCCPNKAFCIGCGVCGSCCG